MILGGLAVIFLLPIGWILNLGARLDVVHRFYTEDKPYFRAFKPLKQTFLRGCVSATTIFCYLFPANVFFTTAFLLNFYDQSPLYVSISSVFGLLLFILGVYTLPGCMTVYACELDPDVLKDPVRAFIRARGNHEIYMKAWIISISAILLSFFGLLFFIVGFFFTSVWAWEVVGYAFTVAMYSDTDKVTG